MPFGYFGAKHGLARFYPPPKFSTVIEPFAGSAGYSCYWARKGVVNHAVLMDTHEPLIDLWHRLQRMTERQLFAIPMPVKGERTMEPLIASASGEQGLAVLNGKSRQITDRMVSTWPRLRDRIAAVLPLIRKWQILHKQWNTAPNHIATWFIDPPYVIRPGDTGLFGKNGGAGGMSYTTKGQMLPFKDHLDLAHWCRSRHGQVIVCEQMPANWLPFRPFRNQRNGVGAGTQSTRTEAIWTNHD